jgi:hypothetical protein
MIAITRKDHVGVIMLLRFITIVINVPSLE